MLDTRTGDGAALGRAASGGTLDVQVAGRGGVPPTGVSAVVLNVTVTEAVAGGFLTAWPSGDARPLASNLKFAGGQTAPNLVMAKLGTAGKLSFFNGGGTANLMADVAGWYGAG